MDTQPGYTLVQCQKDAVQEWLERGDCNPDPFLKYICYWVAFNLKYNPELNEGNEGKLIEDFINRTSKEVKLSIVNKIEKCYRSILKDLNDRTPIDVTGKPIAGCTGVVNLRDWKNAGDDKKRRKKSIKNVRMDIEVKEFFEDVIWLLYTIRNNLFHGGKTLSDANDKKVLENAAPILKTICTN